MLRSATPLRFRFPWAVNADPAFIRTVPPTSQIGVQDGAASYQTGFVPDNFTPQTAGGVPPFGQDFNGVLNETTAWDQWYQARGAITYDASYSTAIGGYPQGAVLDSSIVLGAQWYSTVDNNTTNPDDPATSANWVRAGLFAGAIIPFIGVPPIGFVGMIGPALTIGSAASNANYAQPDALFLFLFNWPNSQLSLFTSGGAPTTRGANAFADWNANKQMNMPEGRGSGLIGVDLGTTFLSGVPIIAGNTTTPGSYLGENGHTLTRSETPTGITSAGSAALSVTSSVTDVVRTNGVGFATGIGSGGAAVAFNGVPTLAAITSTGNTGTITSTSNNTGGGSHNNVERSLTINWGQKL